MSAISPPVQTVLDLFATHLPDLRFGDVDAQSLARVAQEVQAASEVVTASQAAFENARVTLHERQEALLQQVQRALAYARVYAETDEELSARLDAVTLPRPARRARTESPAAHVAHGASEELVLTSEPQPAKRPRGRPRKVPAPIGAFPMSDTGPTSMPVVLPLEQPIHEGLASTGE